MRAQRLNNLVDQFNNHQLQNVSKCVNLINTRAEIIQSSVLKQKKKCLRTIYLSILNAFVFLHETKCNVIYKKQTKIRDML